MSRFNDERLTGPELLEWHHGVLVALGEREQRVLMGAAALTDEFLAMTPEEVSASFDDQRDELDSLTMLGLLAAAEADLRVDYLTRVFERKKDDVSRAFRDLYKESATRVRLDEDLLEIWLQHAPCKKEVGDFRGALKLRHWLAHGRYWPPKLGRSYDADDVFLLIRALFAVLPDLPPWATAPVGREALATPRMAGRLPAP